MHPPPVAPPGMDLAAAPPPLPVFLTDKGAAKGRSLRGRGRKAKHAPHAHTHAFHFASPPNPLPFFLLAAAGQGAASGYSPLQETSALAPCLPAKRPVVWFETMTCRFFLKPRAQADSANGARRAAQRAARQNRAGAVAAAGAQAEARQFHEGAGGLEGVGGPLFGGGKEVFCVLARRF